MSRRPGRRRAFVLAPLTALAVAAGSLAVPSQAVAADGLVLWYKLDESSGAVAVDSSGNGRNGTVVGTPAWQAGQGLGLNGSDTYIKAPNDLLKSLDSVSVSFDVKIDPTDPEKAGGDPFDIKDVGLKVVRFIRITDLDNADGANGTAGFDLDAVAAVHSRPRKPQ